MGLDVTAYSGLKKLDVVFDEDGEPIDPATHEPINRYFKAYANHGFHGRNEGLEDCAVYSYEDSISEFSRGYGAYNFWREELAKLAGYPLSPYTDSLCGKKQSHAAACWNGATGPFSELIDFSDCEGTIGPIVSAKLAQDFTEFQPKADEHPDERFRKGYTEMRRAFEMASNNGAVRFH